MLPGAWDNIGIDDFAKFTLLQVTGVLQGLAFGLIFLNSAAAIVTYFVLPIAFSDRGRGSGRPWRTSRRGSTSVPPSSHCSRAPTSPARSGAQVVTGTVIWVVLPFVVGLWRVLRAEVK